jgi:hypothetical protein
MAKRVCLEPGCPTLTTTSRCERHTRERDRARGTRQQRGYDSAHDGLRAHWQRRLDMGEVVWCWRCLTQGQRTPIDPKAWHLGHDDGDRSRYRGPECVPCNTATAGRRISPSA